MKAFLKISIYQPLFNILVFLIWLMPNNSLGLAIIALTVVMRLLFLPSGIKQGASQEKLRLLQPKIKELQETHKADKAAQSKALVDLYKEAGTSPWGACLPIIIQLIVLLLLYKVFQIGLTTARFDLLYSFMPRPNEINTVFLGIDLAKPDLWVLPIIAGVLQFFQSKLAMPITNKNKKTTIDENPMMAATNQMIYIFPVMTIFIARGLPAALAVYWITTSLFMIGQQYYINKVVKPRVDTELAHLKPADIKQESAKETKKTDVEPGKGVSVTIRRK